MSKMTAPVLETVMGLLDQLEAPATRDETSMKSRQELTKHMMAAIVEVVPAADIVRRLGVNQFTVARWINGGNAPRKNQIDQLRRLVRAELEPQKEKYSTIAFEGTFIGIYPAVDYFFDRVADGDGNHLYVSEAYVFKSLMGFHAADEGETRIHLANLLEDNSGLLVHYVYPSEFDGQETAAHASFRRMHDNYSLQTVKERLVPHPITDAKAFAALGLGYTFCSHFVLNYNEKGKKEYGRELDILIELPCQRYMDDGKFYDKHGPEHLFVEVPQKDVADLWKRWKDALDEAEGAAKNSLAEGDQK